MLGPSLRAKSAVTEEKKAHAAVQEFFDSYLERILPYTAVMPKRAWVENEESRKWLDQLSSCCSNQNLFHVSNELHENLVWTFSCSKTNLDYNKFPQMLTMPILIASQISNGMSSIKRSPVIGNSCADC
jgi:hypothetical protein